MLLKTNTNTLTKTYYAFAGEAHENRSLDLCCEKDNMSNQGKNLYHVKLHFKLHW